MAMGGGGVIIVRNGGGYIARFTVKYTHNGNRYTNESGMFTIGVNKSIEYPAGSTDIIVKAEEMWGLGWSVIFTKEFPSVVRKRFDLYGTTLHPHYCEKEHLDG